MKLRESRAGLLRVCGVMLQPSGEFCKDVYGDSTGSPLAATRVSGQTAASLRWSRVFFCSLEDGRNCGTVGRCAPSRQVSAGAKPRSCICEGRCCCLFLHTSTLYKCNARHAGL